MARILIVEDEFLIAMSLGAALEAEDHDVRRARDGRQAIDVLEEFAPDVVITDYMMPRMDGAELIRRIREVPELNGVPIILMSAVPEERLAVEEVAYDAFVSKPFRESEIVALIARVLAR